ncbi:unnamed protein product [Peniophora sp. CBMAI 1063]|nr:unnamed protein product [Peniophora sp. CBMAI 1063]
MDSSQLHDRQVSPEAVDRTSSSPTHQIMDGASVHPSSVLSSFSYYAGEDSRIPKHHAYYFEEGMVRLLVGDVLFNVPRHILTFHSSWFCERLLQPKRTLPPGWTKCTTSRGDVFVNHQLGLVDANFPGLLPSNDLKEDTFCIYGASAREFEALLAVLMPIDYSSRNLTKEQWIAVLKLSTIWRFRSVRNLSIQHLKHALGDAPLERLLAARAYDVHRWVDGAIQDLVSRDEPLTTNEAAQLSVTDVVRIHQLRETRVLKDLGNDPLFAKVMENRKRRELTNSKPVLDSAQQALSLKVGILAVLLFITMMELGFLVVALYIYMFGHK